MDQCFIYIDPDRYIKSPRSDKRLYQITKEISAAGFLYNEHIATESSILTMITSRQRVLSL